MKTTAVIMAGGKGERFWPKSRAGLPKQFLSLTGEGKTLIQLTTERHSALVATEDIFVVTNNDYVEIVKQQLPDIPPENILAEPISKNTAPCVAFAMAVIRQKYDDALMLILSSDHLIKYEEMYIDTLTRALEVAKEGENIVTIGIMPTYPETGYGYINFGKDAATRRYPGVYAVKRFVEKPDAATAKEYLSSGQYLWNSGMFAWKLSTIEQKFMQLLPETYAGAKKIGKAFGTPEYEQVLKNCFEAFKPESIDYGIMEKASPIYTIPGNFGWDDVGSWLALERVNKTNESGNIVRGDVITINTGNSIIIGNKKLIAAVGLEDVVIVDTDDAMLICAKDATQDVKKVIENLKICNRSELI
ncbi:MAG: sugar phosphate nucleotidyltransferase [Defluviitaleaceae bacterium]|nr:sugar phosphate nucleotidyltransferase [Defluviitaleaceae bacterium]